MNLTFKTLSRLNQARERERDPDNKCGLLYRAVELAGEVGELCDETKKQWRDGSDRRDQIVSELADVGNYAHLLALALGVDLESEMLRKLKEVEQRPQWLMRVKPHVAEHRG
jgi:NTP pyrophosphatase (non-canonical NTP hydrolase)